MPTIRWRRWLHPTDHARVRNVIHEEMPADELAAASTFIKPARRRIPFIETRGIVEPAENWCFWVGETDFRLTKAMAKKADSVPGLERICFLSRYRFRIGIANLFPVEQVKHSIEQAFLECLKSQEKEKANNSTEEG